MNTQFFRVNQTDCLDANEFDRPHNDSKRYLPTKLVDDFDGFLEQDDEPDPMFFVNCWNTSVQTAVTALRSRRRGLTDRGRDSISIHEAKQTPSTALEESSEGSADCCLASPTDSPLLTEDGASVVNSCVRHNQLDAVHRNKFVPQDHARRAEDLFSMTLERAFELLGVTEDSTTQQIKDAYRAKSREWHPDKFENADAAVQRSATMQMMEINEAMTLLRMMPRSFEASRSRRAAPRCAL